MSACCAPGIHFPPMISFKRRALIPTPTSGKYRLAFYVESRHREVKKSNSLQKACDLWPLIGLQSRLPHSKPPVHHLGAICEWVGHGRWHLGFQTLGSSRVQGEEAPPHPRIWGNFLVSGQGSPKAWVSQYEEGGLCFQLSGSRRWERMLRTRWSFSRRVDGMDHVAPASGLPQSSLCIPEACASPPGSPLRRGGRRLVEVGRVTGHAPRRVPGAQQLLSALV